MGFTRNVGSSDRMPDMEAEITNIGVDYQKYKDGKEEHRLIVVWNPIGKSEDRRVQTDILSVSSVLKLSGKTQTITVGSSENFFELEVLGDVIEAGELGYKAAAWLDRLEKLKVDLPERTGNLQELLGLQAVIHQTTFNEALGRKAKEKEKPIWMPIEILKTPEKKVSLKEAVLEVIEGKTEADMEAWYKGTNRYDGSVTPLYKLLAELEKTAVLIVNDKYMVKKETTA
jgi:hypothetical protein